MPLATSTSSRSGRSGSTTAEEQWRNWGKMERQGAMMKVIRALQLNDPAGVFSRELDEDTLRVRGVLAFL